MQWDTDVIQDEGQWLAFEMDSAQYALPIESILEIEGPGGETRCVPGLPMDWVAVMNWHGSALPLVAGPLLLGSEGERGAAESGGLPEMSTRWSEAHILVIAEPEGEMPRLGLPVDRVLGLLEGPPGEGGQDPAGDPAVDEPPAGPLGLCPNELWHRATRLVERACA